MIIFFVLFYEYVNINGLIGIVLKNLNIVFWILIKKNKCIIKEIIFWNGLYFCVNLKKLIYLLKLF